VDKWVEIDVSAEDCINALHGLRDPERLNMAISGMSAALGFISRVPDEMIAEMKEVQRKIISDTLAKELARYMPPNASFSQGAEAGASRLQASSSG
jgi:hypothetical protein